MHALAEKLNLIRSPVLCSHIIQWVTWLASQEPSEYPSSEFLTTEPICCHTVHLQQSSINNSAEVTILELVQVLVLTPRKLKAHHTFLLFRILPACFIRDYISGMEGTFKILHLILGKHVLGKEERIMTVDKKSMNILWCILSYPLSFSDRLYIFKVTIGSVWRMAAYKYNYLFAWETVLDMKHT